ncbi:integrase arm-type DNA-binding domain-containing protein [Psychrobacter sp. ANT_WB68]|uniref:integrase arm-type DNA-binding domain-containing protein n=1 Tax=Psychrobacter sp. ANT_WB68 TaxID=2597355 RepID=UPI0011F272D1|nr:integrase arm-type DNA-binding domain-containing protein [Psychrobacter sp. ANT_WB68]KAA0914566.1 DUF4102 domain-containing protein [Psychrobacter sp. ANT_WB68]
MAKIIKPLTDSQVKQAKPQDKPYKLADGGRLYLYVSKLGAKSWRMDYIKPINKKRATITLGLYPDVTLSQARIQRKVSIRNSKKLITSKRKYYYLITRLQPLPRTT